jgi:ABC-type lipoprotein release transport system permease subunit
MIWKTAWKNVWRNKVRSLVVMSSVTIGIFGGVFAVAVMNGAIKQRVDSALNNEVSHIQIDRPGFRDNYDIQLTIPDLDSVMAALTGTEEVEAVAPRIIISGMANTASKSAGVQILGIEPDKEKQVFNLYKHTIPGTGDFFETESRHNLAYIGQDLAKELNIIRYIIDEETLKNLGEKGIPAEVLDKLSPFAGHRFYSEGDFEKQMKEVLTRKEQDKYGRLIREQAWSFSERSRMTLTFLDRNQVQTGAVFRIAGIYDIKNNVFEMSRVFVRKELLSGLTGLAENEVHRLDVRLKDMDRAKAISTRLSEEFPDLEILGWKEIQPDLAYTTDLVQKFYSVFMIIILAALAFGIVNTMLMVVLERTKELGMLTAIGMNKKRVFSMIMLESVFLSLTGGVLGMIVSQVLIMFTSTHGIRFSKFEEGFEALGYSSHIYPDINLGFFITVTILIIVTGILSSVYPAVKALKLDPADALRTE